MLPAKVSIIIVTFNANKTIQAAIESITSQVYPHKEIIVIDGGSKDGTINSLVALENKLSYWKSEPDNGIYDAMNKGIKISTGEWIFFLGADDLLSPGILEAIFSGGGHEDIDLLYGKINLDGSGKTLGKETDFGQLIDFNIPHQAIFYNKSIFKKLGVYDLKYKVLADYDLNLRIFETPGLRKKFIDKELSVFNSKGISNRLIDVAFFTDKLAYFIDHIGLSKTDKRLGKYYFFIGVAQLLKKQYFTGIRNMIHPVIFGGRRIYYFMVACNVILTFFGIGRKFKYIDGSISNE